MAACFMANLILDGYKIHVEKMNYVFIKAENVSRRRNEKKAEEESLPRPLHALIGEIRKLRKVMNHIAFTNATTASRSAFGKW